MALFAPKIEKKKIADYCNLLLNWYVFLPKFSSLRFIMKC